MDSDAPLDHAMFQLSPRRSRCELFVSGDGRTERIASGFFKPFVAHLKVAEEQASRSSAPSIKLEVERRRTWFNRGTLERFVRFVSTPDVLELANTFDAEMLKLEEARGIYKQGSEDQLSGILGENEPATSANVDITKKGLLKAVDSRLVAVKQDLTMACARASAAGFTLNNVSELNLFAQHFGAHRLSEVCREFISLCHRRPELTGSQWSGFDGDNDDDAGSSSGSDMSIDGPDAGPTSPVNPAGSGPDLTPAFPGQGVPARPGPTCQHPSHSGKPAESGGERSRRVSVLDRINLFESRRKEQSTVPINNIAGAGGGINKPAKAELRRLHSDISADASGLRRWSGATSTSNNPRNTNTGVSSNHDKCTGIAASTTPSSPLFDDKTDKSEGRRLKHAATELIGQKVRGFPTEGEGADVKDRLIGATQFRTVQIKAEAIGARSKGPSNSQIKYRASSGKAEGNSLESEPLAARSQWTTFPRKSDKTARKEASFSQASAGAYRVEAEEEEVFDLQGMKLHMHTASGPTQIRKLQDRQDERPSRGNQQLNDELRMKADELEKIFAAHKRRVYGNQMASSHRIRPEGSSMDRAPEAVEKRASGSPSEHFPEGNLVREGSSDGAEFDGNLLLKTKDNQDHVYNMMQKLGNLSKPEDSRGKFYERYMQKRDAKLREEWGSKRAQKEAQMKALHDSLEESRIEMEARFTGSADRQDLALHAHRRAECLRSISVHSGIEIKEQLLTVESLRIEAEEDVQELSENIYYGRDKSSNDTRFSGSSSTSIISNKLLSSRSVSSSVTLTSLAPISRPSAKATNTNWQQTADSFLSEEDEDPQRSSEQVQYHRNKSYNGTVFSDGSSRSIDPKKLLSSRSVSSSTAPTSLASVPRPTVRTSSSGTIRRRNESSIPVPSDFRKENTKPSNGIGKAPNGAQSRNFARSKSTSEGTNIIKEEKPGRSQSQRKSLARPTEMKGPSPLHSDSANLTQLRYSKEQSEHALYNKNQRGGESNPILRKANMVGPGSGARITKRKPPIASEILKNGEESEASVGRRQDSPDMVDAEDGDSERTPARGRVDDFPADSDYEYLTPSQGWGNSGDPCVEDGYVWMSPSQADFYHAAISSSFNYSSGNVQESPVESPGSWNLHIQNSFSYAHEASNTDASLDTPTGSPASWNLHPLNQMRGSDSPRIRKKWGSVQKPDLDSNDSPQSSKDATKGFKRLFGFGWKSKGVESIVTDGASASATSEGDDDTEDGHDQANRSTENPRMSRMGYPLPAYDGFNVDEIFPEQVQSPHSSIPTPRADFKPREDHRPGSSSRTPRSFFSLPSFRSRGSESKLRELKTKA